MTTETDPTWVPTGADYVSDRAFSDFPLSAEVLRGLSEMGYRAPTPVQAATIEPALAGRDLLVRAKTGTGKTTAFGVPLVERVPAGTRRPTGLVLAPTRELAQQIADEITRIATFRDVSIVCLYGGVSIVPQADALAQNPEIIVGTPGRILDHIGRKNLDPSSISMVVLDEADEMLSMGFFEDVTRILDTTPKDRQILLFSATISPDTERLASRYMKDVENIRLSTDADKVENITHVLYETTTEFHKVRSLLYLLDLENPTSAIIFCNTREDAATVATFLDRQGLDAQLLSGELTQARRNAVMTKVKAGEVRFLVSTDVASRGIDISDLSHVINYALPPDPAVYLHRVGRTGRIGKHGTAISLSGGADLSTRKALETTHAIPFQLRELPDPETAVRMRVERQAEQIRSAMGTMVFESLLPMARALKERADGEQLIAAALRAFFQWDRARRAATSDVVDPGTALREGRGEGSRFGGGSGDRSGRSDGRREERRGDRRDRPSDRSGDRGDRPAERGDRRGDRGAPPVRPSRPAFAPASVDELDALLLGDDATPTRAPAAASVTDAPAVAPPADGAKKKRRRRRKKKGPGEASTGAAGDEADDDDTSEEAPRAAASPVDDLDALLFEG